jgi:DNA-binding CsgD family transcriptional regulator
MVGFTALFVAAALGLLSYQRRPFGWLRGYLVLLSAQAVFDLSFTFVVFSDLFSGGGAGPGPAFSVLQAAVSMILLYAVPRFVQRLSGIADRRGARAWSIVPVAIVAAGYVLVFLPITFTYERPITIAYYGYLAGWFIFGWLGRRRMAVGVWKPWISTFLIGAGLWYAFTTLDFAFGPILLVESPELPFVVLSASLFNIFWATLVIIPSARFLNRPPGTEEAEGVPEEFVREFGLSRREREVLEQLCEGSSNKDIAEALFISPRTVENHIYNLYRKCGVGRRLELCNLLLRYR